MDAGCRRWHAGLTRARARARARRVPPCPSRTSVPRHGPPLSPARSPPSPGRSCGRSSAARASRAASNWSSRRCWSSRCRRTPSSSASGARRRLWPARWIRRCSSASVRGWRRQRASPCCAWQQVCRRRTGDGRRPGRRISQIRALSEGARPRLGGVEARDQGFPAPRAIRRSSATSISRALRRAHPHADRRDAERGQRPPFGGQHRQRDGTMASAACPTIRPASDDPDDMATLLSEGLARAKSPQLRHLRSS